MFGEENADSLYNTRGQLEESLFNTAKLLETLDKNNRLQDVEEYNFLLTGMEGLIGQFSDNHHDLHHEIQEIMESSRMGLLTHEKLVEMVSAEQIRSQYLSNIVGSLRDQIENLFTTIMSSAEEQDNGDPEELLDKVSSNVNLMWKSVESMSKVIASPSKRLDQTIRKIDSEVVVHLSKTLQQNDGKVKENFTDKLDRRLQKAKEKEDRRRRMSSPDSENTPRRSKVNDSSSRTNNNSDSEDSGDGNRRKGPRPHRLKVEDDLSASSPRNGEGSASRNTPKKPLTSAQSFNKTSPSKTSSDDAKKFDTQSIDGNTVSPTKSSHVRKGAGGVAGIEMDDNLSQTSLENSVDHGNYPLDDGDSIGRGSGSGRHHHHKKHRHQSGEGGGSGTGSKKHSSKSRHRSNRGSDDGEGSSQNSSRRPTLTQMPGSSRRPSLTQEDLTSRSINSISSNNNNNINSSSYYNGPGGNSNTTTRRRGSRDHLSEAVTNNIVAQRVQEEKAKWLQEHGDSQRVDMQCQMFQQMIPVLQSHGVNTEQFQKVLDSMMASRPANAPPLPRGQSYGLSSFMSAAMSTSSDADRNAQLKMDTMDFSRSGSMSMDPGGTPALTPLQVQQQVQQQMMMLSMPSTSLPGSASSAAEVGGVGAVGGVGGAVPSVASWSSPRHVLTAQQEAHLAVSGLGELSQLWGALDTNRRQLLLTLTTTLQQLSGDRPDVGQLLQRVHSQLDPIQQQQLNSWRQANSDLDLQSPSATMVRRTSMKQMLSRGNSYRSPESSLDGHHVQGRARSREGQDRMRSGSPSNPPPLSRSNSYSPERTSNNGNTLHKSPLQMSPKQLQEQKLRQQQQQQQQNQSDNQPYRKPLSTYLQEQLGYIDNLVRDHLVREGIHDRQYHRLVGDFIQQVLSNAAKSVGDHVQSSSADKNRDTQQQLGQLQKRLALVQLSLPAGLRANRSEMAVNTDLVMLSAPQSASNVVNNGVSSSSHQEVVMVDGSGQLLTTTTVRKNSTSVTAGAMGSAPGTGSLGGGGGWELPVFDNREDILITRTYRPPEQKADFLTLLNQASDPLRFLYDQFRSYLSQQEALRLFFACMNTEARLREDTQGAPGVQTQVPDRWRKTQELVSSFTMSILSLDDETKAMRVLMLDLEHIVQDAVQIVKSAKQQGKLHLLAGPGAKVHPNPQQHAAARTSQKTSTGLVFDDDNDDFNDEEDNEDTLDEDNDEEEFASVDEVLAHRPGLLSAAQGLRKPKQKASNAKHKRTNKSKKAQQLEGSFFTIDDPDVRLMESHLFDVQRLLGELEARILTANLQQLEYRAFFQTLQVAGPRELPAMLREFPEVQQTFQTSQEVQARLVRDRGGG